MIEIGPKENKQSTSAFLKDDNENRVKIMFVNTNRR